MANADPSEPGFAATVESTVDSADRAEHTVEDRAELEAGAPVGDYVVERKLGQGGFGTVYQAIHPVIGKRVAVKVLSRRHSADPHILSRFIAEARAVNEIRHPNIVDIFAFGELPDGRRFYVMELLEGPSLSAHLEKHKRLPIEEVAAILEPLARALDAAHERGIAHRDLKPANIILLWNEHGRPVPKLLDFGIAKLIADDIPRAHNTGSGIAVGTPEYMSPEQIKGSGVDQRTDAYSFGVLSYRMLVGQLPFRAASTVETMMKHLTEMPPPGRSIVKDLPEEADRLLMQLLSKDQASRPDRLLPWVHALSSAATPPTLEPLLGATTLFPAIGERKKWPVAVAVAAAVIVLSIGIALMLPKEPAREELEPTPAPVVRAPVPPPIAPPPAIVEPSAIVEPEPELEPKPHVRAAKPSRQKTAKKARPKASGEDDLAGWEDP